MKKLGVILSFYAVLLIQLHAVVPHSHQEEVHCEETMQLEEDSFFHLLEHFFMMDMVEGHLEYFAVSSSLDMANLNPVANELDAPIRFVRDLGLSDNIALPSFKLYLESLSDRAPPTTV